MSNGFRSGLVRLRESGRARRRAVMCAKALWWRCHRRIIADHLVAGGEPVFLILGPDKVAMASLTPSASAGKDTLTHPQQTAEARN